MRTPPTSLNQILENQHQTKSWENQKVIEKPLYVEKLIDSCIYKLFVLLINIYVF